MRRRHGFTLLELMTALVIIAILAVMLFPAVDALRSKAEKGTCINNLKTLYVGGTLHIQEHGEWPQIPPAPGRTPEYANAWFHAFERYGVGRKNWVCPSIQRQMHFPDLEKEPRADYSGTTFDDKPMSPYKWPTHPWFVERGDMHGDGNLVIFTNSQIKTLTDVLRDTGHQASPN